MSIKRRIEFNIRQRKIEVVFTNERLITPSGLSIVGGLLKKSEFVRLANRMPVKQKRSEPQIKNGDILLSYIGLLCQGKTCEMIRISSRMHSALKEEFRQQKPCASEWMT